MPKNLMSGAHALLRILMGVGPLGVNPCQHEQNNTTGRANEGRRIGKRGAVGDGGVYIYLYSDAAFLTNSGAIISRVLESGGT